MLDDQYAKAKAEMKSKPDDELGSFKRAITNADGAWMTRGHHSQNFTFHMRDYFTNAIIYYQHLCHKCEDEILEDNLYEGTSKAAEGYAAINCKGKNEGMNIAVHWQDDDSSGNVFWFFLTAKNALRRTCCTRLRNMLKKLMISELSPLKR